MAAPQKRDNCVSNSCRSLDSTNDAAHSLTKAQIERKTETSGVSASATAKAVVYEGGHRLEIHLPKSRKAKPRQGGGTKKAIYGFSNRSAQTVCKKLGKVQAEAAVEVSLTFAESIPDGSEAKRMLKALFKRLQYRFPRIALAYRLEAKERRGGIARGKLVPHFHCIVFNVQIEELQEAIPTLWHSITKRTGTINTQAGVRIVVVRSFVRYVRYMTKHRKQHNCDGLGDCGQRHGFLGWKYAPSAKPIEYPLSIDEAHAQMERLGREMDVPVTGSKLSYFGELDRWER